jgi:hypothetical protein
MTSTNYPVQRISKNSTTNTMSSDEGQCIASPNWWPDYDFEFDGALSPVPVSSMFTKGGDKVVDSTPSILPDSCPSLPSALTTNIMSFDKGKKRITSPDWWPEEYEFESNEALPPVPVGSIMFTKGGDKIDSIPSILSHICPSPHLSSKRITSHSWVQKYEKEVGAPTPAVTSSSSIFSEGSEQDLASIIPSIDPALPLSGSSRVSSTADSSLDPFPLSDLNWMSTMAERVSSWDWVIEHLLDGEQMEEDPTPSSPKLAGEMMAVKSAVLLPNVTLEKKPAEEVLQTHLDVVPALLEYVDTDDINEMDVLAGRGGKVNNHPGNIRYRNVVSETKAQYKNASRTDKTALVKIVVKHVHNYGGRFLKKDKKDGGRYFVMTEAEARKKTSQALRQ